MKDLEKLTISELIALRENCAKEDRPMLEFEIELRTGINVSTEHTKSHQDKYLEYFGITIISILLSIFTYAAVKLIIAL